MQKTWCDLLGTIAEDCSVHGKFIVRKNGRAKRRTGQLLGDQQYKILYSCEDNNQAMIAFKSWIKEVWGTDTQPHNHN